MCTTVITITQEKSSLCPTEIGVERACWVVVLAMGFCVRLFSTYLADRIPKPNKQWEDSVIETTEAEPVIDYRLAPPAVMQPSNTYETGYDGFEPQDSYNYGVTVSVHQDEEE